MFHMSAILPFSACLISKAPYISTVYFDADESIKILEEKKVTIAFPAFPAIMLALINHPEFDASKLSYSQVETELGEFIERVWYDQEELTRFDDDASSSPKDTTSWVGWLNINDREGVEKYTDQYIDENELWSSFE